MKSDHAGVSRHDSDSEKNAGYHSYEYDTFVPPLRIVSSGSARWRSGHTYARKDSNLFGIELVTAGECSLVQEGRSFIIRPGEVYILRRGCSHVYTTGQAGYLHKRYLTIDGPALEQMLHACGLAGRDYIRPAAPHRVESIMRSANRLIREKMKGFTLELSRLAYDLFIELGRSTTPQYPTQIRTAIELMQQNLDHPLSSEQIYGCTGLSPTHFNRIFRQYLGTSPVRYFITQRMSWASHLLIATALSVKEISATIGYEDPLYFSAQFKKYTGLSPRDFRRHPAGRQGF